MWGGATVKGSGLTPHPGAIAQAGGEAQPRVELDLGRAEPRAQPQSLIPKPSGSWAACQCRDLCLWGRAEAWPPGTGALGGGTERGALDPGAPGSSPNSASYAALGTAWHEGPSDSLHSESTPGRAVLGPRTALGESSTVGHHARTARRGTTLPATSGGQPVPCTAPSPPQGLPSASRFWSRRSSPARTLVPTPAAGSDVGSLGPLGGGSLYLGPPQPSAWSLI